MQVVSTGLAIVLLWGFVIWGLVKPRYMFAQVNEWKSWISYNFTWFYIGAFVSQPSPVSNTVLLPPSKSVKHRSSGTSGNSGERTSLASAMRRVDASVRALIGTPRRLVSFAPHARVCRLSGLRRTRQHQSDSNDHLRRFFKKNPCFPAGLHPKSPFRRAG